MEKIVFLLLISACFSNNAGILVTITPEIVNSLVGRYFTAIEKTMQAQTLPSFDLPVKLMGVPATLEVDNMRIDEFNIFTNKTGVTFTDLREVIVAVPDVFVKISFGWTLKNKVKNLQTGTAKIEVSEASFLLVLNAPKGLEEVLKVNQCDFKLKNLNIVMDKNKNSATYNWFLEAANRKLKANVVEGLNDVIRSAVYEKVNSLPKVGKENWAGINSWLSLNLGVLESLTISKTEIQAKIDGKFKARDHQYEIDFKNDLDFPSSAESHFSASISEYSFNTLALASFKNEPIFLSSKNVDIELATSTFEPVFASIVEDFSDVPVTVTLTQTSSSLFKIKDKAINSIYVIEGSLFTAEKTILSLEIKFNLSLEFAIIHGLISAEISDLYVIDLKVTESHLTTPVDLENLKEFSKGASLVLRPYLTSKYLKPDFVLPSWISYIFTDFDVLIGDSVITLQGSSIS